MKEPPGPAFERYLAEVERTHPPRQRYRSGPARWWHPLPGIVMLGGALALAGLGWTARHSSSASTRSTAPCAPTIGAP